MNNDSQKIIIVIIVCIAILAGTAIFFAMNSGLIFSEISSEVSSNSENDELANLKANYTELEIKFNNTRQEIYSSSSNTKEDAFISAELELIRAKTAINDFESVLKSGKSSDEIDKRIKTAKEKLNIANQAYNNL